MERKVGTVSRGVRCPIIREGDDLVELVAQSIVDASLSEGFHIQNKDIVGITESIVARAQGNYASVDDIAADVKAKLGGETVGVIFPIFSRNRFSTILKGIAMGSKKIVLMLQYPSDEVGNALLTFEQLDKSGVNPYSDVLDLEAFREAFGESKHPFTGIDYVSYYESIVRDAGCELEIVFSNKPSTILNYTDRILACDVHTNARTKRILFDHGAEHVFGLDDILTESIDGCGYNDEYGLLGSNKSTETSVKLFPRDSFDMVEKIQTRMHELTGKVLEVMVYGDGAFKDPVGQIWELADPTVSPGYTCGLVGTPNEIKLKYLADNDFKDLSGEALTEAMNDMIRAKDEDSVDDRMAQGTTPRRLIDLVGSLCDLTSGSGDKGTPIVYIQGYFDNFANE